MYCNLRPFAPEGRPRAAKGKWAGLRAETGLEWACKGKGERASGLAFLSRLQKKVWKVTPQKRKKIKKQLNIE